MGSRGRPERSRMGGRGLPECGHSRCVWHEDTDVRVARGLTERATRMDAQAVRRGTNTPRPTRQKVGTKPRGGVKNPRALEYATPQGTGLWDEARGGASRRPGGSPLGQVAYWMRPPQAEVCRASGPICAADHRPAEGCKKRNGSGGIHLRLARGAWRARTEARSRRQQTPALPMPGFTEDGFGLKELSLTTHPERR